MNTPIGSLVITCVIVFLSFCLGIYGSRRKQANLEEWAVGGRGFGLLFVYILMAGETFTTFSVLGISGWVYSRGGPTLYALTYLTLAQVIIFFVAPAIWERGKRHGLQTLGDYFAQSYGSPLLTGAVALASVAFLAVYLQLQLTGLGAIVEVASYGRVGRTPAIIVSGVVVAGFVSLSGVRGAVWVSFVKDFLLIAIAIAVGFGLPYAHFGGIGAMFSAVIKAKPQHLMLPGSTTTLTHTWFITTVLVNSLAFAWPHYFGSIFTAKSADTLRRNSLLLPLYVLPLALIVFAGCASILIVPAIKSGDLAMLTAVRQTFPSWALGIIGGAGALTALVPASVLILSASTLVAKNLCQPLLGGSLKSETLARIARSCVIAVTALALLLALASSASLVGILLFAYTGISQFAPGIVLTLLTKRATAPGVLCGLVCGLVTSGYLFFTDRDPFLGVSAGLIGLIANVAALAAVSAVTRSPEGALSRSPEEPA